MAVSRFLCPQCQAIGRTSKAIPAGTKLRCRHCGFRFEPAEGLSQLLERDEAFALLEPAPQPEPATGPVPAPAAEPEPAAGADGPESAGGEAQVREESASGPKPAADAVPEPTPRPREAGPARAGLLPRRYALLESLGRAWVGLAALALAGAALYGVAVVAGARLAVAAAASRVGSIEAELAALATRIGEDRAWATAQEEPEIRWFLDTLDRQGPDPSFFVGDDATRGDFERIRAAHPRLARLRESLLDSTRLASDLRAARSELESARKEAGAASTAALPVLLGGTGVALALATVGALLLVVNDTARHLRQNVRAGS
jgi:hypothetical protein